MKVVGLVLLLVSCWSTPRPSPPRSEARIDVRVDQARLANGLRVVVVSEPTQSEVAITLRYAVGDADDPVGREGLAHLTEHVLFEPVLEQLESGAIAFNGYTRHDSTLYVEHARPDQLAAMLAIEARRMRTTCEDIGASAFERQRDVVRNEVRERGQAAAVEAAIFGPGHPFARSASAASVASIARDQVCTLVAARYTPENAVLVVSGRTTLAEVRAAAEAAFGQVAPDRAGGTSAAANAVSIAPRHQVERSAPVDREWVLLAWPLPSDPARRVRVRAVADMVTTLIQAHVNGVVRALELGAGGTTMFAIAVSPREISADDALATMRYELTHTNSWFGSGLYEHAANRATYQYISGLDHDEDRDIALADDVSAGHTVDIVAPLHALRAMTRDEAHDLIGSALDPDAATVVRLHPESVTAAPKSGLISTFDERRERHPEDPRAAHAPIVLASSRDPLAAVRRYKLPNGLNVVLAPLGSMPVVDVRLVFPIGTADDPATKHGLAELAAEAIDAEADPDTLRFIQAGGSVAADAAFDHTAFVARGLASQLDALLLGLGSVVREGNYDAVPETVRWLNASLDPNVSDRIAEDAWRTAIYGANHPYHRAGMWAHADRLSVHDLLEFRATHYVAGGATLIVAGNFDPADAERWITYYFADWHGTAAPRLHPPVQLQPLAFAQARDSAQLDLRIAFAAPVDPAVASVVAEMVDEASADVRDELAATYGVHATLANRRLGSTLVLAGAVDATRAADVARLLRDRLARLSGDEMLFVSARRRVLARVRSVDTTSSGLAERFARDVDVVDPSADAVAALTLERIAPAAAALDPSRAAILLRGPVPAMAAAAAGLGRTATPLK